MTNWYQVEPFEYQQWTKISVSSTGQYQSASTSPGYVYVSSSYGSTWIPSATVDSWFGISISSTGQYQTACASGGYIITSNDYGTTWTSHVETNFQYWSDVAISGNGQFQLAALSNVNGFSTQNAYLSIDYGVTWTIIDSFSYNGIGEVAVCSSGAYQGVSVFTGDIYLTSNYGNTWTSSGKINAWHGLSISANGEYIVAVVNGGYIFQTTDIGVTWIQHGSYQKYYDISISSNGKIQTAVVFGNTTFSSEDYGNTWFVSANYQYWRDVSMSSDGSCQAAVSDNYIYVSKSCAIDFPTYTPTIYPTFQPTAKITSLPSSLPSISFTPTQRPTTRFPTLNPTISTTRIPTSSPTSNVDIILINVNITIDNYASYTYSSTITQLDQSTIQSIIETTYRSMDLQETAFVTCQRYANFYQNTIIANVGIYFPLEGVYSNLSPDAIYIIASSSLEDAITQGTYTNILESTSRTYNSQNTYQATVTKLADLSSPIVIKVPSDPNSPTSLPTKAPVFSGDIIQVDADLTIDNYNSSNLQSSRTSVSLSSATISSIIVASTKSLDLKTPAYVTCPFIGDLQGNTLKITISAFYPLQGIYSSYDANSVFLVASFNLNTAINSGDFTNDLQIASADYNSIPTLTSTVTTLATVSSPQSKPSDTTSTTSSSSSPSDNKTTVTIIIVLAIILAIVSSLLIWTWYCKKSETNNVDVKNSSVSDPYSLRNPLLGPSNK